MDARQLRFFLAVVDHGGISRAAEALYLAQPSVTQTVRRLEAELGTALFAREGRGLKLTSAGAALVPPALQIQRSMAMAAEAVARIRDVERGRLDITVTSDLAIDPLASFIAAFRSEHPGVRVDVLEARKATSVVVVDQIRQGECELGLCPLPVQGAGIREIPLGSRELIFALPPGTTTPEGGSLPLSAVADIPIVIGQRGDMIRELVESTYAARGLRARVQVEVDVVAVHAEMVLAGVGAAFLPPEIALVAEERGAKLCRVTPGLSQRIGFVARRDSVSCATETFLRTAAGVWADSRRSIGRDNEGLN